MRCLAEGAFVTCLAERVSLLPLCSAAGPAPVLPVTGAAVESHIYWCVTVSRVKRKLLLGQFKTTM